jgi:hypothetical protein
MTVPILKALSSDFSDEEFVLKEKLNCSSRNVVGERK